MTSKTRIAQLRRQIEGLQEREIAVVNNNERLRAEVANQKKIIDMQTAMNNSLARRLIMIDEASNLIKTMTKFQEIPAHVNESNEH